MCGLFGSVGVDLNELNEQNALNCLIKRGPDQQKTYTDKTNLVKLGHTRLSVIDLSEDGNQPMSTVDGRYTIVYNGEIYNYKEIKSKIGTEYLWRTHSDTEVILASYIKWGAECLHEFHGMFAFSIWDNIEKKLFAARDRLGVKPFYYTLYKNGIVFASRPKAFFNLIADFKSSINRQAMRYYLESGYIPSSLSIYNAITKLEAGHYLEYTSGVINVSQYWSVDKIKTNYELENVPEKILVSRLDDLINQSVEWRMHSDVPLGVFLSGGIDSSLIAGVVAKKSKNQINTFTIGFNDKRFDESMHAENVSSNINSKHFHEILNVNDLIDLIPTFFEEYDEPFYDFSAFPMMAASRLASREVIVCLSGDGGDEAFGGYHYYQILQKFDKIYKFPSAIRGVASSILKYGNRNLGMLSKAISFDNSVEAFAYIRSVIKSNTDILNSDFYKDTSSTQDLFSDKYKNFAQNISTVEAGMRLDINYTLPDDYLTKVDLSSMAFSIEAREPLLDHSIIEWAATLPMSWKIRNSKNKYLLRQLAYKYVDKEILDRPKMGFKVPVSQWLKNELRSWADTLLLDESIMEKCGLNYAVVQKLWNEHINGEKDNHTTLWTILVLLQFMKDNIDKIETL